MSRWQILKVSAGGEVGTPVPNFSVSTVLVFEADREGEALAGAIAARHGASVLGRITALAQEGEHLVATRSVYGGRIVMQIRVEEGLAVATANQFSGSDGKIALGTPVHPEPERVPLNDQRVSLESARIVLGGGRGLDEAGFALLERLADALGGAVSATLPAVDLGLASVSQQVGQSGKFITPALYFAVGMSGTPQHLAGIGSATRLVAVNCDRDASIFRFAEAAAASDARVLLPLVLQAVEAKLGRE